MNRSRSWLEQTARQITLLLEQAADPSRVSGRSAGALARLDPRAKLFGFLALIVVAAASHRPAVNAALLGFALLLAMLSGRAITRPCLTLAATAFGFASLTAHPALLLLPGPAVSLGGWNLSAPGLTAAAMLTLRSTSTAALASLLVLTTPWPHLLKALRCFRVPRLAIAILAIAYRTVFLLLRIALETVEARRTRIVAPLPRSRQRQLAVATAAVLLDKSLQHASDVNEAMQARGFRGDIRLMDEFAMKPLDWAALLGFIGIATTALLLGSR
jgi:energy-coupling factor transporter transmembrane protein EcfT